MQTQRLTRFTRPFHTHLNRLIVSRLPFALPPSTESPLLYATGLSHFASVYYAFETEWHALAEREPVEELSLEMAVTLSSLIHLLLPALSRTDRLQRDLQLLLESPADDVIDIIRNPSGTRVQEFVTHIKHVAASKPHALIAYAWVLYMALFNGGRWIRSQLLDARDSAWELEANTEKSHLGARDKDKELGLAFWHFDGPYDGEDHKEELKCRLADVESMLGSDQRADIVNEAKTIFRHCALLVEELDEVVAAMHERSKTSSVSVSTTLLTWFRFLIPLGLLNLIISFVQSFTDRAILPVAPPSEAADSRKKAKTE